MYGRANVRRKPSSILQNHPLKTDRIFKTFIRSRVVGK